MCVPCPWPPPLQAPVCRTQTRTWVGAGFATGGKPMDSADDASPLIRAEGQCRPAWICLCLHPSSNVELIRVVNNKQYSIILFVITNFSITFVIYVISVHLQRSHLRGRSRPRLSGLRGSGCIGGEENGRMGADTTF